MSTTFLSPHRGTPGALGARKKAGGRRSALAKRFRSKLGVLAHVRAATPTGGAAKPKLPQRWRTEPADAGSLNRYKQHRAVVVKALLNTMDAAISKGCHAEWLDQMLDMLNENAELLEDDIAAVRLCCSSFPALALTPTLCTHTHTRGRARRRSLQVEKQGSKRDCELRVVPSLVYNATTACWGVAADFTVMDDAGARTGRYGRIDFVDESGVIEQCDATVRIL